MFMSERFTLDVKCILLIPGGRAGLLPQLGLSAFDCVVDPRKYVRFAFAVFSRWA